MDAEDEILDSYAGVMVEITFLDNFLEINFLNGLCFNSAQEVLL